MQEIDSPNYQPSKVFIVNFAGHDYTPAKKWGELTPITTGFVDPEFPDRVLFSIIESIKDSTSEDWICVGSGLGVINAIAATVWYHKHKKLKMLLWNRENGTESNYFERVIKEEHIAGIFEVLEKMNKDNAA